MAGNCEYTKIYLNKLKECIGDDCEFSQPLSIDEYNSLAMSSEIFRDLFFKFIGKGIGIQEWNIITSKAIDCAQDILNFYIAQDFIEAREGGSIVFPLNRSNLNQKMIDSIAEILKIESVKCAMHGFDLPQDRKSFERLLKVSKAVDSRHALMEKVQKPAMELDYLMKTEPDKTNLKAEIRLVALGIANDYNKFIEDLEKYSGKSLKIKRSSRNSLLIAHELVKPKINVESFKFCSAEIKFNLDEYAKYYDLLLNQSSDINKRFSVDYR